MDNLRSELARLDPDTRVARAVEGDIAAIIGLLAADDLGRGRESDPAAAVYVDAFRAVDADPRQLLTVLLDGEDRVVGTLQLVIIPGLSRSGTVRAIIEAVRVADGRRGTGLGTSFLHWAIAEAGRRGATLVQLTSDLRRVEAHRFYERLGFTGSHLGMKLELGVDEAAG